MVHRIGYINCCLSFFLHLSIIWGYTVCLEQCQMSLFFISTHKYVKVMHWNIVIFFLFGKIFWPFDESNYDKIKLKYTVAVITASLVSKGGQLYHFCWFDFEITFCGGIWCINVSLFLLLTYICLTRL